MSITIEKIFYSPVKSLSFNKIKRAEILKGIGIKDDRIFSFIKSNNEIQYFVKIPSKRQPNKFITLRNNSYLYLYNFIYHNKKLTLNKNKKKIFTLATNNQYGLDKISKNFIEIESKLNKSIKLIKNSKIPFFDTMLNFRDSKFENSITLLNLNSIASFSKRIGQKIEYQRFRANLYIKGMRAWDEKNYIGKKIKINNCIFKVSDSIPRCSVTNLIPNSKSSNLNIPLMLKKLYGHINMGIYLYPLNDGNVNIHDKVKIIDN